MGRPSLNGLGGTRGAQFCVVEEAHVNSLQRYIPAKLRWFSIRNLRGWQVKDGKMVLEFVQGFRVVCHDNPETVKWRLQCCQEFLQTAQERRTHHAEVARVRRANNGTGLGQG